MQMRQQSANFFLKSDSGPLNVIFFGDRKKFKVANEMYMF